MLDPGTDLTKRNVHELPEFWGWIAIIVILAVGLVSKSIYLSLPHALEIKDLVRNRNNAQTAHPTVLFVDQTFRSLYWAKELRRSEADLRYWTTGDRYLQ